VTKDITHTSKQFLVEVMQEIHTPRGMTIYPGDYVVIDPDIHPTDGDLAIIDGDLVPWAGQAEIQGVAVGVSKNAN
jgi:SOS-response transcriptional repressor LexA